MRNGDIPSCPELESSLTLTHTRLISLAAGALVNRRVAQNSAGYLYANWNIWEDPQVDFRSFDLLDFPLDDLFGGLELLGRKPDSVALYTKTPFAVSESCAFSGTSDGDRDDTLVSFDVFNLPGGELVSEPGTQDGEGLAGRGPWPERRLGTTGSEGSADFGSRRGEEGEHRCPETRHASRYPKLIPLRHRPRLPQVSVATMSDRKRAFEGSGDSNASKKLKRFVFFCRNLALPTLIFAFPVHQP